MEKLCNVYISSCRKDGGIYHYSLTPKGKLIYINQYKLDRPMYLAVQENHLYALLREPFSDNHNSAVVTFDILPDGSLEKTVDLQSTHGEVSAHLTIHDQKIYTANYISGSVTQLPDKVVNHLGSSEHKERQKTPHPHYICVTPDGKYLAVADLGIDKIITYDFSLKPLYEASVPRGHGARHLAFSDDGKWCFCANELLSTISVFRYDDGTFLLVDTIETLPKNWEGESTLAAIRVDGEYLYVSHRGYNCISQFVISEENLRKVNDQPCGGDGPRDFNIFDRFLICANEKSDNVVCFEKDQEIFDAVTSIETIAQPNCIVFYQGE